MSLRKLIGNLTIQLHSFVISSCRSIDAGNSGNVIGAGGAGGLLHTHDWLNSWSYTTGGAGARGEVRVLYNVSSPGITSVSVPTITCSTPTVQSAIT